MRLIVLRGTPEEVGGYDGWWFNLDNMDSEAPSLTGAHFAPTGEYETRADGAKGEVYRRAEAQEEGDDQTGKEKTTLS